MAEKNTHSILETIKKKMQKLDRKPAAESAPVNLGDEFEYIVPAKKDDVAKMENKAESPFPATSSTAQNVAPNTSSKFEDSLGFDDAEEHHDAEIQHPEFASPYQDAKQDPLAEPMQNAPLSQSLTPEPAAPNQEKVKVAAEDFDFNDLDLDDESDLTHNQPNQVKAVLDRVMEGENFSEDDIEDYEDEVEMDEDEDMDDIINSVAAERETETNGNDFNLDELEIEETHTEEHHEEKLDEENHEEKQEESMDDGLIFDDLELEKEEVKPAAVQASTVHDPLDDISLEELEQQAAESLVKAPVAAVVDSKPKAPQAAVELDDIDLEFEKELMGFKASDVAPAPKAAAPLMPVAQPETPQNIEPVIEQKITPIPVVEEHVKEDLDWDLDEEVKPVIEKEVVSKVVQQESLIEAMPASTSQVKNPTNSAIIYDSTLRKTTESIRRLVDAKNVVSGITAFSQSPAFSELAVQLMEPKLEKWLNEHLPEVVERIVREEIKKIIPKE